VQSTKVRIVCQAYAVMEERNLQATDKHGSKELQLGLGVHLERLQDRDGEEVHQRIRSDTSDCITKIESIYINTTITISIG